MQKGNSSFLILISVFFFWGFVAASNDILIPVFKEKLNLEQWQSQMISFAFYVAYTVGSVLYVLISKFTGGDMLNKLGYKNGIALGLFISAIGTLLFYPAAQNVSFPLMISGLFIVGLGFSLQQTAANPLTITIGDPNKGSQRLSLAGGINNVGTTIGPLLVSFAIFGSITSGAKLESIEAVKTPYLILGIAFIIVALLFKFSSLPNQITYKEEETKTQSGNKKSVFEYPQLVLGMIAIFLYVGVEVSTASNLPEYMKQYLGTNTDEVAPFVSLFWASLMIGRWTGAVQAFGFSLSTQKIMRFVLPYLAFGVFLLANFIAGKNLQPFYLYAGVITVLILADLLSKGSPARQLFLFSVMGILALVIGMLTSGMISVYALISVGLFCSTLWPCIFTLAISGLGKYTNQGSSYLIMMIMGGGFISLLQGWLASDHLLGINASYLVGVGCFLYLAYYGWKAKSILNAQGITYEKAENSH
ncbi:MAG: MFS transporter [Sphingobacteriaceae bacterium]|nr:MFS transporter [Sphingobacteriaceae bacterium]